MRGTPPAGMIASAAWLSASKLRRTIASVLVTRTARRRGRRCSWSRRSDDPRHYRHAIARAGGDPIARRCPGRGDRGGAEAMRRARGDVEHVEPAVGARAARRDAHDHAARLAEPVVVERTDHRAFVIEHCVERLRQAPQKPRATAAERVAADGKAEAFVRDADQRGAVRRPAQRCPAIRRAAGDGGSAIEPGLDLDATSGSTLMAGSTQTRNGDPDASQSEPGPRDRGAGAAEVVQGAGGAPRRGPRGRAREHLRPARLERGGQDHGREDPVHAAQGGRGDGRRQRLRRRDATGGGAGVDQPHRAVRRRRRDPQRAGEPRADGPAAAPAGPGQDRRRPARAVRADRRGRAEGGDVLGRDAPPPGHRDEPHREPAGDLPRRADDRARPAGAHRGVAGGRGARRQRHDGAAHDAVPGGGRTARRPDRDPPPGPDHRQRHPGRAQAAAPARQGRVRREAADPRGRLPRARRRHGEEQR